jgi:hypothetical protein
MKKLLLFIAIFAFAIVQPAYAFSLIIRGGQLIIRGGHFTIGNYALPVVVIPSYVQSNMGDNSSNATVNPTVAFTSSVTTGDLIVAVANYDGFDYGYSITDNKGNTYTEVGGGDNCIPSEGPQEPCLAVWYAKNVTGGSGVQVSITGSGAPQGLSLAIAEYSGLSKTAPLDAQDISSQGSGGGGSGQNPISNSITATAANDIVIVAGADDGGYAGGTPTAGSGYTLRQADQNGIDLYFQDELKLTAGSVSGGFTTVAPANWAVSIVAFKK